MFIPHKIMTKMICVHYTGSGILLANEGDANKTCGEKTALVSGLGLPGPLSELSC